MSIVEMDASGYILSLAIRSQVTTHGPVPEPGAITLTAIGLAGLLYRIRRR